MHRLVGLGLKQRLALVDGLAGRFQPGDEAQLIARLAKRRHPDRSRHVLRRAARERSR